MRTAKIAWLALAVAAACGDGGGASTGTITVTIRLVLGDGSVAGADKTCEHVHAVSYRFEDQQLGTLRGTAPCLADATATFLAPGDLAPVLLGVRPSGALEGDDDNDGTITVRTEIGSCTGGMDEDGDAMVDCADVDDCGAEPACNVCGNRAVGPGEECDDGNMLDGDGCSAACKLEERCSGGVDEDADTFVDCDDQDCDGVPPCGGVAAEACSGGVDEDGDTLTDCFDPDCDAACPPGVGLGRLDPGLVADTDRFSLVRLSRSGFLLVGTAFRPSFVSLSAGGWVSAHRAELTGVRFTASAPGPAPGQSWVGGTLAGGEAFVALLDGLGTVIAAQRLSDQTGELLTALVPVAGGVWATTVTTATGQPTRSRTAFVTLADGSASPLATLGFAELAWNGGTGYFDESDEVILVGSMTRGAASEGILWRTGQSAATVLTADAGPVVLIDALQIGGGFIVIGKAGGALLIASVTDAGGVGWIKRITAPAGGLIEARRIRRGSFAPGQAQRAHIAGTFRVGPNDPSDMLLLTIDLDGAILEARSFGSALDGEVGHDLVMGEALGGTLPAALVGVASGQVVLAGLSPYGDVPAGLGSCDGALLPALNVTDAIDVTVSAVAVAAPPAPQPTSANPLTAAPGTTPATFDLCGI